MDESTELISTDNEEVAEDEALDGQDSEVEEETAEPGAEISKSSKEVARLIDTIKNLQVENARLKSGSGPEDQGQDSVEETHPALEGLERDEKGNVLFHGTFVSPEFAIEQYEQAQLLDGLRHQAEQERQARVESAQRELFNAVESAIVEMREESLPGLGKEHAALADEYILTQADQLITRALVSGEELSPELIERTGREALAKAKQLFGIFGERQIKDNQEYAETYRVKPDGRPGTRMPVDESKLSKAERNRLAQERTRLAMAMRKSG